MAILIPPITLIRLRKNPPPTANWGFKWHCVEPTKKRLTCCGIIIRDGYHKWEGKKLNEVKAKNVCKRCIGGNKVINE